MPNMIGNAGLSHSKHHLSRSTVSLNPSEVTAKWFVIDAENLVLGRLASIVSQRLRAKHKAEYTPHVDSGDRIIVVNAEKIAVTGKKLDRDILYRHTGFPGGIKAESTRSILNGKHPHRRLEKAIRGMMPRNTLSEQIFKRNLYVYAGPSHPHEAQQPEFLDVASLNSKNVKGQLMAKNPGIVTEIREQIDVAFTRHVKPVREALEKSISESADKQMELSKKLHSENSEQIKGLAVELEAIRNNTKELVSAVHSLIAKLEPK